MARPLFGKNNTPQKAQRSDSFASDHAYAHTLRENEFTPVPLWMVRGLLNGMANLSGVRLTQLQRHQLLHNLLIEACGKIAETERFKSWIGKREVDDAKRQLLIGGFRQLLEWNLAEAAPGFEKLITNPPTHDGFTVRAQASLLTRVIEYFPKKSRNLDNAAAWIRDHWSEIVSILSQEPFQSPLKSCSEICARRTDLPSGMVLQNLASCRSAHVFRNELLAYHHKTTPAFIKQLLVNRDLKRNAADPVKAFEQFLHESSSL